MPRPRPQELYGPPAADVAPAPKPREPSSPGNREDPDPILCADSSVDAMLTLEMNGQKRTYAFKGAYYWRLTSSGLEKGYPRLIRDMWGGLPDNLDAILPYEESDRIYFFKVSSRGKRHARSFIRDALCFTNRVPHWFVLFLFR